MRIKLAILNLFPILRRPIRILQALNRRIKIQFISKILPYSPLAPKLIAPTSVSDICLNGTGFRSPVLVNPQPCPIAKSDFHLNQLLDLNRPYLTSELSIYSLPPSMRLVAASYSYQRSGGHVFALGTDNGYLLQELSFDIFGPSLHVSLFDLAPRSYKHIHNASVIVLEPQAPTYGHWMLELLPRLLMSINHIKSIGKSPNDFDWYISGSSCQWEIEALDMLGLSESKINFVNDSFFAIFHNALVPSFTSSGAVNLCPTLIAEFVNFFVDKAKSSNFTLSLITANQAVKDEDTIKLYLRRSGETFRNVINEDAVVHALSSMGFLCVSPRDLSFKEKVFLFSRCTTLIGVLSSGMSHCVFMRPGSFVVNLLPTGYFPPAEARVSRCVGVNQIMLPVSSKTPSSFRYSDVHVDLDQLLNCISMNNL